NRRRAGYVENPDSTVPGKPGGSNHRVCREPSKRHPALAALSTKHRERTEPARETGCLAVAIGGDVEVGIRGSKGQVQLLPGRWEFRDGLDLLGVHLLLLFHSLWVSKLS